MNKLFKILDTIAIAICVSLFALVIVGVLYAFVEVNRYQTEQLHALQEYRDQQLKMAEANKSKAEKLASELKSALKDSGVKIIVTRD